MRSVTVYKTSRNNTTKYKVLYDTKEITYTSENVPQTVKAFMQNHNFTKINDTKMIFR